MVRKNIPNAQQSGTTRNQFVISSVQGSRNDGNFSTASHNLKSELPTLEGEKRRSTFSQLWNDPEVTDLGLSISVANNVDGEGEAQVAAPAASSPPKGRFRTAYSENILFIDGPAAEKFDDHIEDVRENHTDHFELRFDESIPGDNLVQGKTPDELSDDAYSRGLFLEEVRRRGSDFAFDWVVEVSVAYDAEFEDRRNWRRDRFEEGKIFPFIGPQFAGFFNFLENLGENIGPSNSEDDEEEPSYPDKTLGDRGGGKIIDPRLPGLQSEIEHGFDINIRGYARVRDKQKKAYEQFLKVVREAAQRTMPKDLVNVKIDKDPSYPNEITVEDGDWPVPGAVHHEPQLLPFRIPRPRSIPLLPSSRRAYQADAKELWNFLSLLDYNAIPKDQSLTPSDGDLGSLTE